MEFSLGAGPEKSIAHQRDRSSRETVGQYLAGPGRYCQTSALGTSHGIELHEQWKDMCSWMSHVPDDTKLCQLTIRSTHQSLALHGAKQEGQSQGTYLGVRVGIRFLDLRFDRWVFDDSLEPACLSARHENSGPGGMFGVNEGYSLLAVFFTLTKFLRRFPKETIIVNIKRETDTDDFLASFLNDFNSFHIAFTWTQVNGKDPDMSTLSLGDVRRRLIILSTQLRLEDIQANPGRPQPSLHYLQDEEFLCETDKDAAIKAPTI